MLKKLCLFKIIILTLRHNSKVKPRLSGTQNHQRFYLQHKMISIMARIERTYSQEKVKQMLKLNEVLLDYLQRELPSDAVFPSKTDKGMNVLFTPTLKLLLNLIRIRRRSLFLMPSFTARRWFRSLAAGRRFVGTISRRFFLT